MKNLIVMSWGESQKLLPEDKIYWYAVKGFSFYFQGFES